MGKIRISHFNEGTLLVWEVSDATLLGLCIYPGYVIIAGHASTYL
jgi:hypothetical protein